MGQSYRIRTELGINKVINVQLDQQFEFLEILSIKLQQEDIYTKSCAEYGVVVGRVTANNGFGIPNARVSVFIPIDSVDESNPLISSIYPYKSPNDRNEDGYRYNLLPYEQSYSTHAATGTLPTRLDVLTGSTAIEIYDKYYKFSVKTNDSGDYMIMGVPQGQRTLVMDVDLSDIGEFSLTPQDLIRMGLATEAQVAGNRFRTSSDLNSLPQIINFVKELEVSPLWGDPELCDIAINRVDFDLRDDANVDIQPTAVFLGSMFSSPDNMRIRPSFKILGISTGGKPRDNMGNLCELVPGPGQILAIRQTIDQDSEGNPILEVYQLEQSGNVIDGDGTWLVELPMNLDYFITNEFGEKVISYNPTIGIPTKAKYRFKIKWQQPNSLSERIRRPYYLVPNIKEYIGLRPNSYYFGLDWSGYTSGFTATRKIDRLNEIINCEDTFYEFTFNKVYTVASLIDEYKKGARGQFIGIKEIGDSTCASSVNTFPVNEGVRNFDFLFFLFSIVFQILSIIGPILLTIYHILAFLWNNFAVPILALLIALLVNSAVHYWSLFIGAVAGTAAFGATAGMIAGFFLLAVLFTGLSLLLIFNFTRIIEYKFPRFKLSMMTYPDCQACQCVPEGLEPAGSAPPSSTLTQFSNSGLYYDKLNSSGKFCFDGDILNDDSRRTIASVAFSEAIGTRYSPINVVGKFMSTKSQLFETIDSDYRNLTAFSVNLPLGERINVFNTRKKYFDGVNQINVTFDRPSNTGKSHTDNTLTVVYTQKYEAGQLITFVSPELSNDVNYKWTGDTKATGTIKGIRGTSLIPKGDTINVIYADTSPTRGQITRNTQSYTLSYGTIGDGEAQCVESLTIDITGTTGTVTYNTCDGVPKTLTYSTGGFKIIDDVDCINLSTLGGEAEYIIVPGSFGATCQRYTYPLDIEYFQVLTALTITEYFKLINPSSLTSSGAETFPNILNGSSSVTAVYEKPRSPSRGWKFTRCDFRYGDFFRDFDNQYVTILQRGVDPYSPLYANEYGVGKLFGFTSAYDITFTASTRINTPIQPLPITATTSVQDFQSGQSAIFTPSNFFLPGVAGSTVAGLQFSAFSTNAVRYYGSYDANNNPTPRSPRYFNTASLGSVPCLISATANQAESSLPLDNPSNFYNLSEDLSGNGVYVINNLAPTNEFPPPRNSRTGGFSAYLSQIFDLTYSYTPSIPFKTGMTIDNRTLNVMRTDRLPSSDYLVDGAVSVPLLQQNLGFQTYLLDNDGVGAVIIGYSTGASVVTAEIEGLPNSTRALESFNCETMVGLKCYTGFGDSFGIKPGCSDTDNIEFGCYTFLNRALFDLNKDLKNFSEWTYRFRFFYALCRGVLSQSFTNNWINGTLYAFPIQVNTYFDLENNPLPPNYPTDVVYFDDSSNNFYYRSSPYNLFTKQFVGQRAREDEGAVNVYNLLYPTTIINLGVKDSFYREVNFDASNNGYIIPNIDSTSYSDTSDLINFFVISRITDETFLEKMLSLGDNGIQQLFSRSRRRGTRYKRVDGDLAQLMSINCEIGNIGFSPEFYTEDAVKIIGTADNPTIAVWYSSTTENLQTKDYLTPGRINFRGENNVGYYPYPYGIKSQVVPFYQWKLDPINGTIFGTQNNDWATDRSDIVQNRPYQSMDRLTISTPTYFTPSDYSPGVNDLIARGYIFSVDLSGNYQKDIGTSSIKFMVGAPFHFYFGTVKGASALDKFKTKYSINE
jgi:hypothetical protein